MATQEARLAVTVEPIWPMVRDLRVRVATLLADFPEAIRDASSIVAAELLENAVKYGEPVRTLGKVCFELTATPDEIRIQVLNGSADLAGVAELERLVAEVSQATDKEALYLRRLEYLFEHAGERSRLGIYRVGVEGSFDLECSYRDEVVTVKAVRTLEP